MPTQGYKVEILRRKEIEWEERKARIPEETPQEKSSYSATKRDFEDMFYHSSDLVRLAMMRKTARVDAREVMVMVAVRPVLIRLAGNKNINNREPTLSLF